MYTAGKLLTIGIPGKTLNRQTRQFLKVINPGGIILFSRNLGSVHSTQKLIQELYEFLEGEVYFAIDHEGGLVVRRQEELIPFAGNYALAKADQLGWIKNQATMMSAQLKGLGFSINFAPVVDVLSRQYNPGITIRSFGSSAKKCSLYARQFIQAFQKNGMWATAKHFPGKGSATLDAHIDLPTIKDSRNMMVAKHLLPFKSAIKAGVNAIMSTHVVYTSLDPGNPATFSKKIIQGLLKEKLGFKGVIYSDDMDMGAITKRYPFKESILKAYQSGHDQILVCHHPGRMLKAYQTLKEAKISEKELNNVIEKIKPLWHVNSHFPSIKVKGNRLYQNIVDKTVAWTRPFKWNRNKFEKIQILFPDLNKLNHLFYIEPSLLSPTWFEEQFRRLRKKSQIYFISLESEKINKRIVQRLNPSHLTVMFCFNGTQNNSELELLKALEENYKYFMVVCMRNPYDAELLRVRTPLIQTYGFRIKQVERALKLILKESS